MVTIEFPNGSKHQFPENTTGMQIAESISQGLAREATAIKLDDAVVDLSRPVKENVKIKILTFKDKEGVEVFRHSSAHLLAHAVTELYPEAKLTIGPVVEEGFYYDIDHSAFHPEDLEKIEKKMKEIVDRKLEIIRHELPIGQALKQFEDNPYKIELIQEQANNGVKTVSVYQQGNFQDLCTGPHLPNTGKIKAFKLTKLAGAYWRADQKNKQLQRIYGISFAEKKQLDDYLKLMEEAKKRDHRVLGRQLDLLSFSDLSPGSAIFHPKGTVIYNQLLQLMREQYFKRGYKEVITPQLFNKQLWETSGHWSHYKENMFLLNVENQEFSLKPMNCPSHLLIYKISTKSYRDLPLRLADFCYLHRNELSGVLNGLFRVRKFSQDDSHIFCTPEQIKDEIEQLIKFIHFIYNEIFDFSYSVELSTRPEQYLGDLKVWEEAEESLAHALKSQAMPFKINPGDGAFYGPKIDFHIKDCLGRTWQCATIQLDFNQPARFEATYEGSDGKKHPVVVIHRAIFGSLERFLGILIEHFAGKFPFWLAPEQIRIVTIADRFNNHAEKVKEQLQEHYLRVEVDGRAETVNKKIREAQLDYIPIILTIGEKEVESNTVALRTLDGQVKFNVPIQELIGKLNEAVKKRSLKLQM